MTETKYCPECDISLPINNFNKSKKSSDGFRRLCKKHTQEDNKNTRQLIRLEVLIYYSGETPNCDCCGENNLEFLSIDHINGDGNKHRKNDSSSIKIYNWLKRNNFPEGFRVLCMNCNFSHGRHGYCPHVSPSKLINKLPDDYTNRKYRRWSAKVSLDDVLEIRRKHENGESSAFLAKEYKISKHSVNNIIARRRWKDV